MLVVVLVGDAGIGNLRYDQLAGTAELGKSSASSCILNLFY